MPHANILLIDDHAMFRSGLRMVIDSEIPGANVFEAGHISEALHHVASTPDVILLDIHLPGLNGVEGILLLKRKWPLTHVVVLSSQDDPEIIYLVRSRGAADFVSKTNTAEKIVEAVNLALNRNIPASWKSTSDETKQQPAPQRLTPRQFEVLDLLYHGMSNKLIARQLQLSENTVRVHVQAILTFLGVSSRAEALVVARRQGLVG
jgi:DNA-binding NarL/FixJ family response regulator